MSMILESSTRSVTLPNYAVGGLGLGFKQNMAKNYPLGGNMYVDFFNTRSPLRVTFPEITRAEFEELKAIFNDQISNAEFLTLTDADLGLSDLSVFLSLPDETALKWNRSVADGVVITLEPEYADSI